jgi:hypothetical protein
LCGKGTFFAAFMTKRPQKGGCGIFGLKQMEAKEKKQKLQAQLLPDTTAFSSVGMSPGLLVFGRHFSPRLWELRSRRLRRSRSRLAGAGNFS